MASPSPHCVVIPDQNSVSTSLPNRGSLNSPAASPRHNAAKATKRPRDAGRPCRPSSRPGKGHNQQQLLGSQQPQGLNKSLNDLLPRGSIIDSRTRSELTALGISFAPTAAAATTAMMTSAASPTSASMALAAEGFDSDKALIETGSREKKNSESFLKAGCRKSETICFLPTF